MHNKTSLACALVLSSALLAACGGGGGDAAPASNIGPSASALVATMRSLIAATSESSEPIDVNTVTMVGDDRAEPSPL